METAIALAMIVGATELVKRLFDRDWRASVIILVAVIVGALCGLTGVDSLTVPTGIVLGFSGSGFVTAAQHVGKKGKKA